MIMTSFWDLKSIILIFRLKTCKRKYFLGIKIAQSNAGIAISQILTDKICLKHLGRCKRVTVQSPQYFHGSKFKLRSSQVEPLVESQSTITRPNIFIVESTRSQFLPNIFFVESTGSQFLQSPYQISSLWRVQKAKSYIRHVIAIGMLQCTSFGTLKVQVKVCFIYIKKMSHLGCWLHKHRLTLFQIDTILSNTMCSLMATY